MTFFSCSFIPGSTRVSGSSRPKSAVRTIKTYAVRLQEMKHIPAAGKNQIQWRYTTDAGGMDSAINCLLMHNVCSGLIFCKTQKENNFDHFSSVELSFNLHKSS